MRKTRGFKLGRKFVKVIEWVLRRKTKPTSRYQCLDHPPSSKSKAMSKLCNLGLYLKRRAKRLCFSNSDSGYIQLGQDPHETKPVGVPKGHLAVYVGEKGDDTHRFLVPVIYFNHPLFGELLREAEKEYGYNHSGGITIPCRISEFENVQMKIAAGENSRRPTSNRRYR